MRLKFIEPLMPTLVEKPPEGDDWIHEIKFDGYRSQIILDHDVRIFTRNGLDWTAKYRDLAGAAKRLGLDNAIIDGEIVVLNEAGLSDFAALRKAITRRQQDLYFVAFDLLHLNGHDLRDMGLEDRREILEGIIQPDSHIQFSQALPGEAKAIFELVDKAGIEGMVSKRRDSKYRSGRSTNWLKIKSYAVEEYDLLGVEREPGKPAFALMADRKTGQYVGSAFINSSRAIRERLWQRVQANAGPAPKGMKRPATEWVKPGTIIGRVKSLRGEDELRHASFQDFREE
ncbi:RNA ligase family protein [Mesorhizobium sp. INR15]|uniref:ATP-dependent DNA ligase n=1 Tax=Mesorhizobium sp. INR15 TaxID=2654248 RepID=UPI0018966ED9|nr:ATP-dependent DNA ligase [Mesorhizobium sp. INR15]QPC90308.1 ATP-dependent DNA ligase [Mesorhizobium sp. INR15]